MKPNGSTPDHSTDSPYKGLISELKRVELDKSDDFKSPVKWKAPKVFQKKSTKRKGTTLTRNKQQSYIANLENSDVNPDHLQMAVAMSKSCYESENPSVDRNAKGCSTLERFGFSSNKPKLPPEHSRTNMFELPKNRKNSKFRFITPVLMMRAEIDRESLITEKISSILQSRTIQSSTHNDVREEYEIISTNLNEYICKERKVSSVENQSYEHLKSFSFYIALWDKTFSTESKCGWLLRKWEDIPGREKSPGPLRKVKKNLLRDTSPDLFDSDYESFSPKPQAGFSVKNVFESQSGIEHFESFCETPHMTELSPCDPEENVLNIRKVSEAEDCNIIDLSQSDSEEIEDNVLNCKSPNVENTVANVSGVDIVENSQRDFSLNADSDAINKLSELENCNIIDLSQSDEEIENEVPVFNSPNVESTTEVNSTKNCPKDFSLNADDSETTILNIPIGDEISIQNYSQNSLSGLDQVIEDLKSPPITQREKDDSFQDSNSDNIIVISDEELNYSSANRNLYDLSDDEDEPIQLKDLDDDKVHDMCSNLRMKYCLEKSASGNSRNSSCSTSEEETPVNSMQGAKLTQLEEYGEMQTNPSQSKKNSLEFEENLQPEILEDPCNTFTCNTQKEEEKSNDSTSSVTPKSNILIKSKNVTPMQDYDRMETPEIQDKLKNFGIKALKRKRGAQMLKYIYECTHPAVEKCQEDHQIQARKRIKFESSKKGAMKIIGDDLLKNERPNDGLIFEHKHSKKIQSCALPLQIAWYNFIQFNPEVHKKILTYEPLHLELVYGMLKEQSGCKFNAEDLVSFLDKKCITFRVPQQKRRGHHPT